MAEEVTVQDNPKQKLWKTLNDSEYYTKSFEEFDKQFSSDESIDKLYQTLNGSEYYTKSLDEFKGQFFAPIPEAVNEEDPTYGTKQLEEVPIIGQRNPLAQSAEQGGLNSNFNFAQNSNPELFDSYNRAEGKKREALSNRLKEIDKVYNIQQGAGAVEEIRSSIANPTPEQLDFTESVGNSFSNMATRLKGFDDRLKIVSADLWENVLGKELAKSWYELEGRDINQVREEAYTELQRLSQETLPTLGIVDSIQDGSLKGTAAGIINAITSLGSSALPAVATLGAGAVTDLIGDSLYDFNKTKADRLGITVPELYERGEADFKVPASIGAVASGLEIWGLRGVGSLITKQFTTQSAKKAALMFGLQSNKEGLTEWLQEGLTDLNLALAEGKSIEQASKEAGKTLISKRGLEAYLGGLFASAGAGGLAKLGSITINPKDKTSLNEEIAKVNMLEMELKKPSISQEAKQVISQQVGQSISNIASVIERSEQDTSNIPEAQREQAQGLSNKIDELNTVVEDPNVSNEVKSQVQEQIKPLQDELSNIVESPAEVDEKVASPKNILEAFKQGEQGISTYRETVKQQFLDSIKGNQLSSGFNPEAAKYLLEYAVLSIADGTIKSAKMLADAFGIENSKQLQDIYDSAVSSAQEYIKTNPDFENISKRQGEILVEAQEIANRASEATVTDPEMKKLTDYARKLYDSGNIQTAEQFQEYLGVSNPTVQQAFDLVIKAQTEASVNSQKVGAEPTTKQKVKKATEGKITGNADVTNKQALKETINTLNRGIKEGKSQITQASKDLGSIISQMTNPNAKSKISRPTYLRLTKELSNATTKSQLTKFGEKLSKVVDDVNYLDKLDEVNKLQSNIRKKAKAKNIPVDFKQQLKDIASINPNYIRDIDQLIAIAKEANKYQTSATSMLADANQMIFDSEAIKTLKKYDAELKKLTDEYTLAKTEDIRQQLADLGIDTATIESLYPTDPKALLASLQATLTDAKPNRIEKYRETSKILLNMVNEMDTSELTVLDEQYVNDYVKGIDVDGIPDSKVPNLVAALTNLVNFGSVTNFGEIVAYDKVYKNSRDTRTINKIKEAFRTPWKFTRLVYQLGSITTRKDISIKDQQVLPLLDRITGLSDYNLHTNQYQGAVQKVKDKLTDLQRKYKKDFSDNLQNIRLGIYSDVVQFRASWTLDKIESEYENRLVAWNKSLELLKKQAEKYVEFNESYGEYIKNLESVLSDIITVNPEGDITVKLDKQQLYDSLKQGQKEFHKFSRDNFEANKEQFFFNSRVNNNLDVETDWANYIPRSYQWLKGSNALQGAIAQQSGNIQSHFSTLDKGAASGAGETRSISGERLPQNAVLSANMIDNFLPRLSEMIYDSATQADRMYITVALDPASEIINKFEQADIFDLYFAGATEDVLQRVSSMSSVLSPNSLATFGKNAISRAARLGATQSLAGVFAAPKQGIEVINVAMRTGSSFALAIQNWYTNPEQVSKLMEQSNVQYRDAVKSEIPQSRITSRSSQSINLKSLLGKADQKYSNLVDGLMDISIKPLTATDKAVAKLGWLSFYIQYQRDNNAEGTKFSLDPDKVNREAMDYANHMTSLTLNESNSSQKSKITGNAWFRTFFMFQSFAINSKLDLIANSAKIFSNTSTKQKQRAVKAVAGNLAGLAAFSAVGFLLKEFSLSAGAEIFTLIAGADQDEEKKKQLKELLKENKETTSAKNKLNFYTNVARDFAFGGIAADQLGMLFNPGAEWVTSQFYTPEQLKQMNHGQVYTPDNFEIATMFLGMTGLPLRRGRDAWKSVASFTETDTNFIKKRYGVISSDLAEVVVDNYRLSEKGLKEFGVPQYARAVDALSATAALTSMLGFSYQEAGFMRRYTTKMKKELVDAERNKEKYKDLDRTIRDAGIVLELNLASGIKYPLNQQQIEDYKKIRAKTLSEVKTDFPYSRYIGRMTKEEYEDNLRKAVDGVSEHRMADYLDVIASGDYKSKIMGEIQEKKKYRTKSLEYGNR